MCELVNELDTLNTLYLFSLRNSGELYVILYLDI